MVERRSLKPVVAGSNPAGGFGRETGVEKVCWVDRAECTFVAMCAAFFIRVEIAALVNNYLNNS